MKTQANITKEQYEYASRRIEDLLPKIHGNTPKDDPLCVEYVLMSDIVEKYEQVHFPIHTPTIAEIIADALFPVANLPTEHHSDCRPPPLC